MKTTSKNTPFAKSLLIAGLVAIFAYAPVNAKAAASDSTGLSTGLSTVLPDDPTSEEEAMKTDAPAATRMLTSTKMVEPKLTAKQVAAVLAKYSKLDPKHLVPDNLLEKAVTYYDANLAQITNKNYLAVYDYSARSTKARFFIIDMKTGAVAALHSAHGSGSDPSRSGYATIFSNSAGSNASSLGYAKTAETYSGKHGLSLRMDGLSSTNSNIRARAVVIHGASYVSEADVVQGRSWGCPAVTMSKRDGVVAALKGGAIVYFGLSK